MLNFFQQLITPADPHSEHKYDGWSLDDRDPQVIREVFMPMWEWLYRNYFQASSDGWEHIPSEGRMLVVGSHNGGLAAPDMFMLMYDWFARYGTSFQFQDGASQEKPKHTFLRDLEFSFSESAIADPEVVALQDCLKYEGVFPSDRESTGKYGAVTATAVLAFQKKYKVGSDSELEQLQGHRVGPKTRAVLNDLFS